MNRPRRSTVRVAWPALWVAAVLSCTTIVVGAIINLTLEDLHLRGTQAGSLSPGAIQTSNNCIACHGNFDTANDPGGTWSGSLMAQAGRDPLFFAQMAVANQDVANAGYFCLRCHVPMSFATGHAMPPDGSALTPADLDGVTCHFCHSMVDPVFRADVSPPEDAAILAALPGGPPAHYGNAMFVLDPTGTRRGPLTDPMALHTTITSTFFTSGNFCGTCHEVGNIAVSRQPDGTYRYNAINQPTPSEDPTTQFPLERTFSEWRLSAFANQGVDMGGRFGGVGGGMIRNCQDCHMPAANARVCVFGPSRQKIRRHEFAGASAQVLDLIAAFAGDDPAVDQAALARGRAASVSMLNRAADLVLTQSNQLLNVRVVNQSGHKLPTGHIEGRRVWINVRFIDAAGAIVAERGRYDDAAADLDESTTTVYEMHVGLSEAAAQVTGLPAGPTGHMALADTIVKDNRIPPRGYTQAAFEAAGAPVVDATYADGQYWDDRSFAAPPSAVRAEVRLFYQNTPRHYIESLHANNQTNHWGRTLLDLWTTTGRGAPIEMAQARLTLSPRCTADFDGDGARSLADIYAYLAAFFAGSDAADTNGSGVISVQDWFDYLTGYLTGC